MRSLHIRRAARLGWAMALTAMGTPAFAAPYCIQNQSLPPQCNYFDPSQCQRDAARQGGVCSANAQQFTMQRGIGQYCVVTSGGASNCSYVDRGTCNTEAEREQGACMEAPVIAPAKAPDPYSAINGF